MKNKKTKVPAEKIDRSQLHIESSFKNSRGEIVGPGEETCLQQMDEARLKELFDKGTVRYIDHTIGGTDEFTPGKYLQWTTDKELSSEFYRGRPLSEMVNLIRAGKGNKFLSPASLRELRTRLATEQIMGMGSGVLISAIDVQLKALGHPIDGDGWNFEESLKEFTEKWEKEQKSKTKGEEVLK